MYTLSKETTSWATKNVDTSRWWCCVLKLVVEDEMETIPFI